MLKGLNIAGMSNRPKLPAPRVIPVESKEFKEVVKTETQIADAEIAATDEILNTTPADAIVVKNPDEENISGEEEKLSRLVDDDFPFDESQLVAIHGLVQEQYGCLIGAAGTGKTTTTKKLVDMLRDGLDEVDMSRYWQRGEPEEHDDYEVPEKLIPSIVMVSFTGRASQMTKKNFPRDWHGNIMTIHRALGFYPEFFMAYDEESGEMRNKRRFVPSYDETNLMPWDIIIIDECGMLGLELWHQLWAACKPTTRIIMIGDINQLPPTHGKSILGFALAKWPTWELTHIHRQQGANNSIVDNAHRILKGLRPISDSPTPLTIAKSDKDFLSALNYMAKDKDWRFLTVEVPEEHRKASLRIRQMLKLLQGKIYEPNRDVVITPINGFEQTAPGYSLGQSPMNQELVISLNSDQPRYFIDAGRERQNFAVGDKVMATINDYEAGVTNGMTGIVTSIAENGGYTGDSRRYGLITEVNDYLAGLTDGYADEDVEFSLEEMAADELIGDDESKDKDKEKKDAGPASHIVTVRFGEGEHAFEINFDSKSRVASLMLAYVATCHKMQGGECPVVFVIVHQASKRPLNREWFYTGVTRASQRCIVLYTKQGLGFALGKQNIKGVTLEQKVKTFVALTQSGLVGAAVKVKLPQARSLATGIEPYRPKEITNAESETSIQEREAGHGQIDVVGEPEGRFERVEAERAAVRAERAATQAERGQARIVVGSIHINISRQETPRTAEPESPTHDGGDLRGESGAYVDAAPESDDSRGNRTGVAGGKLAGLIGQRFVGQLTRAATPDEIESARTPAPLALPAPRVVQPTSLPFGGVSVERLEHEAYVANLRVPAATPAPKSTAVKPLGIMALLAKQRNPK